MDKKPAGNLFLPHSLLLLKLPLKKMTARDILLQIAQLEVDEQYLILHELSERLEPASPDEEEVMQMVQERRKEYLAGKAETHSWEEVRKELLDRTGNSDEVQD